MLDFFFFFLSLKTILHQWSVLNQIPQGGSSLSVCCERNEEGFLAGLNKLRVGLKKSSREIQADLKSLDQTYVAILTVPRKAREQGS